MRFNRRVLLRTAAAGTAALVFGGCGRRSAPERADVVVIGAGLAGLNAARILEAQGAAVIVLEASQRAGGRVETRFDLPGSPELGAADIGVIYARILDAAKELGLELVPWPPGVPGYWFHVGGQEFTAEQWPTLEINPLDGELRDINPAGLLRRFLPRPNPLPDLSAWMRDEFAALDIPFGQYLSEQGAPASATPLLSIGNQFDSLNAESALWKLRGIKFSMLSVSQAMAKQVPIRQFIRGGMSRLTDEMASSLRREVRFGHGVTAINNDRDAIEVICENGAGFRADLAICTLPLPVLRGISIRPALPPPVARAVRDIPYGAATSVVLQIREPYWEVDGMPPNIWTDLPLQRGFVNPSPSGGDDHLWIFNTGPSDLSRRDWTDAQIGSYVVEQLNRVRPSTKGRVELAAVRAFTRDPMTLGTYASRAPGQISEFRNVFSAPVDRIVFAGEHTAELNSGMEGAMESGERAALAISTL